MKISILIVTRKWNPKIDDFYYLNELKNKNIDFEVLIAEGNNPSSQRNILVEEASGEFVLFLDDDSLPIQNLLERYVNTLQKYPRTDVVGGPSILVEKLNSIYQFSNVFFSSKFGIGPVKNRYNSLGIVRKATERDLILCNLLVRRDFFLKTEGFSQEIHPGEENEFLKRLQASSNIIYDPEAIVYREPRGTLFLFLQQMFSYGKGRSKHLKLNYLFEYIFLIPLFFSLYILSSPLLIKYTVVFSIPLLLHITLSLSTVLAYKNNKLTYYQKIIFPLFVLLGHFSYGLGLIIGIGKYKILKKFHRSKVAAGKIQVHKLKKFKISST